MRSDKIGEIVYTTDDLQRIFCRLEFELGVGVQICSILTFIYRSLTAERHDGQKSSKSVGAFKFMSSKNVLSRGGDVYDSLRPSTLFFCTYINI